MASQQQALFRLAYLLLGDAAEAEDVVQETFIRALRALGSFNTQRPLQPWLFGIAANLARNRQRSFKRYLTAIRRSFEPVPDTITLSEARASASWESQTLWQAIRRLSRSDQEVIYMRYFLELGEREVAQALDVAQGTVKSRLSRALARLRKVIDGDFPLLRAEREAH
ncbi:sigma-70 family RNA polymerase sigma factor [Candidatus Gracilibacteria bacterium]|nr:sigma-70 family RNA polymerase sigma factor [Candidatus Gracilibacteria bacterium]